MTTSGQDPAEQHSFVIRKMAMVVAYGAITLVTILIVLGKVSAEATSFLLGSIVTGAFTILMNVVRRN